MIVIHSGKPAVSPVSLRSSTVRFSAVNENGQNGEASKSRKPSRPDGAQSDSGGETVRFQLPIPYHLKDLEPAEIAQRVLEALQHAVEYVIVHLEILLQKMLGEDAQRFARLIHIGDLARERFPQVTLNNMPAWREMTQRLETLYETGGQMPGEERSQRYEALNRELVGLIGVPQYWALDCEVDKLRADLDKDIVDREIE